MDPTALAPQGRRSIQNLAGSGTTTPGEFEAVLRLGNKLLHKHFHLLAVVTHHVHELEGAVPLHLLDNLIQVFISR